MSLKSKAFFMCTASGTLLEFLRNSVSPRDAARAVRICESTRTPLRRAIGMLWLLVEQLAQDIVSAIRIGADAERRHRGATDGLR
jgi:hypothetical protein